MHEKVNALIDRAIRKEVNQKNRLLRELGLTSDEKEIVYVDKPGRYGDIWAKQDKNGKWFVERNKVLSVTDEEFQEIQKAAKVLGIPEKELWASYDAGFLRVMNSIFLILSVLGCVILIIVSFVDDNEALLPYSIGGLFASLLFYAFNKAMDSINNNLMEINEKIHEDSK